MPHQRFAIIDVETTGKGITGNRITEICIVLLQQGEIIDKFTTLVNPQCTISPFITGLTGIDNDMVRDAPTFPEIAEQIISMTTDAVFVAHNVNFDYNVIRGEFKSLGYTYTRKKLCTVRLSRKLVPGLLSYSLGKLCRALDIPLVDRHRAEGDTDATVQLFQYLLALDEGQKTIQQFINARSKQATLPPHLDPTAIENLPETTGIYLFKDQQGKIIYVGKAKNIKQRVISHFYDKKNREYALGQSTHDIDFETTGNELVALLVEADKIQQHYPKYNVAQKRPVHMFRIIRYTNRKGVIQLAIDRSRSSAQETLDVFYTRAEAQACLEELCIKYQLCPRYCGLQSTLEQCSHYKIKTCKGICTNKESVALYNIRVQQALQELHEQKETYVIREKGRAQEEQSFVLIQEGIYKGYGYVTDEDQLTSITACEDFLIPQQHTYHTTKIIKGYLKKYGERNVVYES
ncbi:exonuclease domain-containing protein [Aquimarina brevivitae]|uniref:DNA polymerase-3 subunit epsilon n=1 Tax=Aquimarina brevivitae TaxID=323412 RepID=A0A4Q7P3A0_9FLAO|nr:exonuclease domain-containing protein [Aquimarina brevivitae]RZS93880.1 DNA polymerase-3 subunit epsilon [Aquimarina brevivitae]